MRASSSALVRIAVVALAAFSAALPAEEQIPGVAESLAGLPELGEEGETPVVPLPPEDKYNVPAGPRAQSRVIEEIVVTAQRREEALQDVPISISAFSEDQLQALGAETTKDLGVITPSLQFTDLAGYTLIFLRGVGTDAFIPSADPSVATYVDGIYIPAVQNLVSALGAVERVEVTKGPQGTLFGRNATGGAISVVLKQPGGEPDSALQLSYGSYDDYRARVYTNVPLTDRFAFSVAGFLSSAESPYERVNQPGKSLLRERSRAARLKLRWAPLDSLEFGFTGQYARVTGGGSLISTQKEPSLLARLLLIQPEPNDYEISNDADPFFVVSHRLLYGHVEWQLPWFNLKLLGSDQLVFSDMSQFDFDGSARPYVSFNGELQFTDQQTGELQVLSHSGSPWAQRFRWVAGLYYLRSLAGYDPVTASVAGTVVELPTQDIVSLIPEALRDVLSFVPAPEGIDVSLHGLLGTRSESAYAQGTLTLTDWLDVTMGGRYQEEVRRMRRSSVSVRNLGGGQTDVLSFPLERSRTSNFSPKVALEFRFIDDVLFYVSWQKGFKSATFNVVNVVTPPEFVLPEEVTALEVGIKSQFLGRNLRLNAAVFNNEIKDLQSTFVSLLSGGVVSFENAGRARIRGVDFDAVWTAMPRRNPGLVVTAGGAYLDARYTDFDDGSGFDETTGLFISGQDFSGNRIVRTPEWSGNLGLSQTLPAGPGEVELGTNAYYNSGFFYTAQNASVAWEGSYAVFGARVSYLHTPWNLRLTVYGDNLGDSNHTIAQFHDDFGRTDTLATPRTFGVRLNWDF